jgi:NADH dehydrogenase
MIKTLILGGTGFVGSAIARQLIAQKESVRVLSRHPASVPLQRRTPGIEYVQGDLFDSDSLHSAMQGCDAVIHAAQFPGAPFEYPAKQWTYHHYDAEGTALIAKTAKQLDISRLIYISGAGAGQGRSEPWFQAKEKGEQAIQDATNAWTIFRPSWIYGPTDVSLNRLKHASRVPFFFPLLGQAKETLRPIYIDDVAKAVGYALNRSESFSEIYALGGPEELSMKKMIQTLLAQVGRRRILVPVPMAWLKTVAAMLEKLPGKPILTRDGLDFITMDVSMDVRKAHAFFPFRFTSFENAISKYL